MIRFLEPDRETINRWSRQNRLVRLLLQLGWIHEACHYVAARLVGLKVTHISNLQIDIEDGTVAQELVTILAPTAVGMTALGLGLYGIVFSKADVLFGLVLSLSLSWLITCEQDIKDALNCRKNQVVPPGLRGDQGT